MCYPKGGGEFPRLSSFGQLGDQVHQRRDEVRDGRKQEDLLGAQFLLAVFLCLPHCALLLSVVLCKWFSQPQLYYILQLLDCQ